ncbi:MAG: alanine--tRNA ligase [Lachnospiraceae bacterium]|nr:alanine--tRNA ligase [Lachnospiraceae bacterium]
MRQFTSQELRKTWIDFYKERGHVDVGAVSLVSDGSTGVMFNVAGMQPLMPYLLGEKHPLGTRLCNVQGCVRTNDIESVGDKSHVTFFEMMGSWSLGDYFKKERCQWSFELLTQVFGFDADHLAATVFAGDENAPRDEEGAQCRIDSGFRKDRIYYLPAEDNWWGLEYGPCGPDSEMFYVADVPDCGPDCGPGCHCGKYTELGNDVFMQYEKHQDGHLTPLKQKNVDTGWGLERILAFLNGTKDVYRTDVFAPVISRIEELSGARYEEDEVKTRSMRILADHLRTAVMLIGDEARLLPDNSGAGYILRRLIRRAVRHGRTLGLGTADMTGLAAIYIDSIYTESYPLLKKNREFILTELKKEIDRFESTLENGMKEFIKILDAKKAEGLTELDGRSAFHLYDTFGFPLELTVEMAEEQGIKVDEEGFAAAMEQQKELARSSQNFSAKLNISSSVFEKLDPQIVSEFTGYDTVSGTDTIAAIGTEEGLADTVGEGREGTIVVSRTPFYATMGGQKGDTGEIRTEDAVFAVEDTVRLPGGRIGHVGRVLKGTFHVSDNVQLAVDRTRRAMTCRNHSATHLLHSALREVLGDHVEQAGSYQDTERTRFDFSHGEAMTAEEIHRVEAAVNEKIAENLPVTTQVMDIEDARKTGAMALFGEKYGQSVRVVSMGDYSRELCGGTHVGSTGEILSFHILSESGIAAGVRRIEAITGTNVHAYYDSLSRELEEAAKAVKATPATLLERLEKLNAELKTLRSENESLKARAAKEALGNVMDQAEDIEGVPFLASSVPGVDMNGLRDLGDEWKAKHPGGVILLVSEKDGKVSLMVMSDDAAVKKGAHAGNLVKEVAPHIGGGGGGRPNMAQAGGKDPSGIKALLEKAGEVLKIQLS